MDFKSALSYYPWHFSVVSREPGMVQMSPLSILRTTMQGLLLVWFLQWLGEGLAGLSIRVAASEPCVLLHCHAWPEGSVLALRSWRFSSAVLPGLLRFLSFSYCPMWLRGGWQGRGRFRAGWKESGDALDMGQVLCVPGFQLICSEPNHGNFFCRIPGHQKGLILTGAPGILQRQL